MAKFEFIKKSKKKEADSPVQQEKKKDIAFNKIWSIAGDAVDVADEICIEIGEIGEAGVSGIFSVGAAVINFYDNFAALVEWFLLRILVILGRKLHQLRVRTIENKKDLIKNALILGAGCICMAGVFAGATDYEYSYNGRPLGIVKEQRDVLEILELASEELSQEYGSNIVIDPEEDITFRPVVSYGKEVDTEDDVLRRLTYMGEINAQASAITVDGKTMVIVENETIAEQVLQDIKDLFLADSDSTEYEYIGFVEDVKIEPCSTKLTNISNRTTAVEKLRNGGQQATEYIVQSGDSIYGICDKLGLSLSELSAMNPGLSETSMIHVGDAITIQKEVPLLTLKTIEVSTFAESIPFETVYEDSNYYYQGESVTSREGVDGKASVTARLTKYNGETVEKEELSRETIIEPVNKIILKGTKAVPPKKGTGTFIWPVQGRVSYGFGYRWGRMHDGIDIPSSTGVGIKAADGGTVTFAGWSGGYGYAIRINHGGNITTLYAHCSKLYVSVGDQVFQGQTIAAVGSTGNSTGPHCHFEVTVNGRLVDPMNYL